MPIQFPPWADAELTADLEAPTPRGESQELEFKRELPKSMDGIAKEIAAFATSNDGAILVGVDTTGDIVGVSELESPQVRDTFRLRIEGTCGKFVKPPVIPIDRIDQTRAHWRAVMEASLAGMARRSFQALQQASTMAS